MLLKSKESRIQEVFFSEIKDKDIRLFIKREDELHPVISGNKYRKLAYNIEEAKRQGKTTLLTFGGAYSNHLVATSGAGELAGFSTIGIVRGNELKDNEKAVKENPTLSSCLEYGMKLDFVTRQEYRQKTESFFIEKLQEKYGDFYLVPEGGTNHFAVKGCEEILTEEDEKFDIICSAVGTGGTISGIINSAKSHQKVIGFPALKGDFLHKEIEKYTNSDRWALNLCYNFGGYGKVSEKLITFINQFKKETNIPLDPVYTGKMLYGIIDMIKKGEFPKGTNILAIHTGGLQGIEGMNKVLERKGKELID
ncbi:MAG: 1-aminocyclopropane-1-carboxylate deaminase/D-cysteine desulfhydrase [Flavobacteriaceae bacterium]|nr:1-aminocyclopropane-1-carboxylate deaminase/D-cysteine desulfhydrase [Flavobacteriaceae bacterium]